jgi:hypothetical protein
MGCVSSKQFHGGDDHGDGKPRRRPSSNSLKRLVSYSSSKRHEELEEEDEVGAAVAATSSSGGRRAGNDASTARLIRKPPALVVEAVPALSEEAATLAVGVVDAERAVAAATGNRKRPPADVHINGAAEQGLSSVGVRTEGEAKPRIRDVPNGVQGEHVVAGWPRWLTEVAAEAVRGWQPRRAESFEKLDKVCGYDGHYFSSKFIILATFSIGCLLDHHYESLPIGCHSF